MVESSALLKRRTPKGYRGFESLPHRHSTVLNGKDSGESLHPDIDCPMRWRDTSHRMNKVTKKTSLASSVTVSVPGTTANLGPGFDSFGLALDVANMITLSMERNPVSLPPMVESTCLLYTSPSPRD